MLYILSLLCVALASAQVPATNRTVFAAQTGLLNNAACYMVSAEYAVIPNASVRGNVFAAAMGITIPEAIGQLYPWTALAYVKGSIDATTYPAGGDVTALHFQAAGSANVLAWSYVSIGEFCEVNNQEGYQKDTTDYIINYYTAPQALLYNLNCGQENDPITGENSYYGSIETAVNRYFNVTCRVFPTNTSTLRNGRIVSPYDFKCDIRIDYSQLWTNDTTKIKGCTDDKRKIGLLMNVAGASVDVDVSVDANLNGAPANTPDGERITFGSGRLQFSWDNYYVKTGSFSAITGSNGVLTASYMGRQTVDASTSIYGAAAIEQIIFSFDAPKSANTIYYWDPTTTLLDQTSSSALSACLSLVALCLLSFFF